MNEHEKEFRAHRQNDIEAGLVDLKFFKSPFWNGSVEGLQAASNAFDVAEGAEVDAIPPIFEQTDVRPLLA